MIVHARKRVDEVRAQVRVHVLGREVSGPLSVLGPIGEVADELCGRAWPWGAKERNGGHKGLLKSGIARPGQDLHNARGC